jgi:hypothetical protein
MGMQWNEELIDGRKKDISYMFPYSQCAILGRVFNTLNDRNINPETGEPSTRSDLSPTLLKELGEQLALSQLTRNTTSVMNFDTLLRKIVNGDTDSFLGVTAKTILAMPANYISGFSRPLADPIQKLSTYALGDDDVKMGVNTRDSLEKTAYSATRYVTNIIRMLGGDGPLEYYLEPKTSMLRTDKSYTSGGWYDILGFKGMDQPTNMEMLLNKANMRPWNQEYRSKFPEADKFVRQVIAPYLEHAAYKTLKDKKFLALSIEDKRNFVKKEVLDKIKGEVIKDIRNGLVSVERPIRGGLEQPPSMGTKEYMKRLDLVTQIAEQSDRNILEGIQAYNKAARDVNEIDITTRGVELLKLSNHQLRTILQNTKKIKNDKF